MEKETTTGSSALLTGIIQRQVGKGGKCPCILILVTPLIVSGLSFSSVQFPFPVTLGTSNLACPEFLQDRFFQGCPFQGKALSSLLWSKCHPLGPQLSPALCIPHPALLLPFFSYCRSPQEVFLQLGTSVVTFHRSWWNVPSTSLLWFPAALKVADYNSPPKLDPLDTGLCSSWFPCRAQKALLPLVLLARFFGSLYSQPRMSPL